MTPLHLVHCLGQDSYDGTLTQRSVAEQIYRKFRAIYLLQNSRVAATVEEGPTLVNREC